MDNIKIGNFIANLRKEKNLTQKELAAKLHITDKAISKWERGLGFPDISLLEPLSEILEVTINELLNGERIEIIDNQLAEDLTLNTIKYSKKQIAKNNQYRFIITIGFIFLIFGMFFLYDTSFVAIFQVLGIILISIGIVSNQSHRLIKGFIVFILSFGCLYSLDFINVYYFGKIPAFGSQSFDSRLPNLISYKNMFYNVYRCNYDTPNEYMEISFNKDRTPCTNPYDPNRSSIEYLMKYKNKYLGNNSNTVNLFYNLPMGSYRFGSEIDSTNLGVTLNYINSSYFISEGNRDDLYIERTLIYNSATAFLLIDNLEYIVYNFKDITYKFKSDKFFELYPDIKDVITNNLEPDIFNDVITFKIQDDEFVSNIFKQLIVNN